MIVYLCFTIAMKLLKKLQKMKELQTLLLKINADIKLKENIDALIGVGVQKGTWFVNLIEGMNTRKKPEIKTLAKCNNVDEVISYLKEYAI